MSQGVSTWCFIIYVRKHTRFVEKKEEEEEEEVEEDVGFRLI